MNLPRLSVQNPVAVNLFMWAVLAAGLVSWLSLTREFFPTIDAEQVIITVVYPGATPEEMEKSVTRLIEREIEDVDDIERIEARVFEGITQITAELADHANRDRVLNDLRGELDKVKPDLPLGAEEPEIMEARPQIPVIGVVLHGNVPERVLHEAVIKVRDDLFDLDSVATVIVSGFRDREFVIEIRPDRLEAYGLTFEEVGAAVARTNLDLPGGQLKGARTNIRVRTIGEEQVARRLEDVVVRTGEDGSIIRLADVATIREGFEDKVERGRFRKLASPEGDADTVDGPPPPLDPGPDHRAAALTVFKNPEQDAVEIANQVKAYVADHPHLAGGAVTLTVSTDIARFLVGRLDLLQRNARMGILLVLLTLAIFLELRIALWVMVGLCVSFAGTFLLMYVTGVSLNFISLFSLIVVLGLIVDDAIVIGENIFTKIRGGLPPKLAAERGATEVAAPVIAAVLTTCVAFVPLAFIGGRMGNFLGVIPIVVICALTFSLIEAFFVLPAHLAHTPKKGRSWIARAYGRFNEAKHKLFEQILPDVMEKQLRLLLRWRYATAGVAIGLLMVAAGLIVGGLVPFQLLQDTDAETVTANLEMAAGTPEETTLATLAHIEEIAAQMPEVDSVFTVVGSSFSDRGPQIAADPATVGQLILELLPAEKREDRKLRTSTALLADLRQRTGTLPGVRRLSWSGRSGGPTGADIEILVRGEDLETVSRAITHVTNELASYEGVDEIYDDLELGKLEIRLKLRPSGRLLGLTTQDLAMQIRHALFGIEAQDLQIGEEEVTVRVVLPEASRAEIGDLSRLWVRTPGGNRVPLEEVAEISTGRGYASLTRIDGRRAATIRAEVDATVANTADVTEYLIERFRDLGDTYPGVSYAFEGKKKDTAESLGSLVIGFPAALVAIFCIIAIVFRSYAQPIIVMLIIPWGLGGAIVGHWIMGFPFTILSMIGAVALAGVVVNDGLILVDYANRARRQGEHALEAAVHAARARLRPILLTSITTIAGLAPLMLERSFQAQFLIPMAISLVFGLAFATALTLLLLPVFYMIFEDIRMGAMWLLTGRYTDRLIDTHAPDVESPSAL